jgi:hypothetical protein
LEVAAAPFADPFSLPASPMRAPCSFRAAALLVAVCFAPPLAAQDVRGILFTAGVSQETGEALLEPVAVLLESGFMEPPGNMESDGLGAFTARWATPGKRYDVLSGGERMGSVAAIGVEEAGCVGIAVRGTLDVRGGVPAGWQGLAGEGLPEQRDAPWVRDVTRTEKRDLDRMAAALFDAHGIDVAARTEGDTATAAIIGHPNARPMLVGSYSLQMEEPVFRTAALLVIAEDGQSGYRPAYVWFHEAIEADVESRVLVDAADLDGDGQPELVVRKEFYEAWSYTILRRTEDGWVEVYHGGGGGC